MQALAIFRWRDVAVGIVVVQVGAHRVGYLVQLVHLYAVTLVQLELVCDVSLISFVDILVHYVGYFHLVGLDLNLVLDQVFRFLSGCDAQFFSQFLQLWPLLHGRLLASPNQGVDGGG